MNESCVESGLLPSTQRTTTQVTVGGEREGEGEGGRENKEEREGEREREGGKEREKGRGREGEGERERERERERDIGGERERGIEGEGEKGGDFLNQVATVTACVAEVLKKETNKRGGSHRAPLVLDRGADPPQSSNLTSLNT